MKVVIKTDRYYEDFSIERVLLCPNDISFNEKSLINEFLASVGWTKEVTRENCEEYLALLDEPYFNWLIEQKNFKEIDFEEF
jgi:hypothetical protein